MGLDEHHCSAIEAHWHHGHIQTGGLRGGDSPVAGAGFHMDGVARGQAIMDIFRMYMWMSIVIFICLIVIFLVSPESFVIG